jgi:hypothetical protein
VAVAEVVVDEVTQEELLALEVVELVWLMALEVLLEQQIPVVVVVVVALIL